MIERLIIASKNPDKIAEIEAVLVGLGLVGEVERGVEWPDVEETEDTIAGNALLKARAVHRATGLAALADDTGLEVEALEGGPGVHTGRFAGPDAGYADNVAKLLAVMEGVENRAARFVTVMALVGDTEVVAEGVLEGRIALSPRGSNGFGYDPVFEVDHRTLAEIPVEEKNRISHRARALRNLAGMLRSMVAGR